MPVDTPHNEYVKHYATWRKIRDAIEGEEAVKAAGSTYLPTLGGQSTEEYDAYKNRGYFFGATGRTITGLIGAVMRKRPEVLFPKATEQLDALENIGPANESLFTVCKSVVSEVLSMGRVGIYVDADKVDDEGSGENGVPYITLYHTENIINWRVEAVGGRLKLVLVVLQEKVEDWASGKDEWEPALVTKYRVLRINAEGKYEVEVFKKVEKKSGDGKAQEEFVSESVTVPTMRGGNALEYIPFYFVGPDNTDYTIDKSPILDLVNVNLSHYRTAADLEHGRHFTALPTAWVAGFDVQDTGQLRIGSQVAWVSKSPEARAGFLEFSGAGLRSLERALTEKQKQMAVLGARLLEEQKRESETAEALKLRQSGESSILGSIAMSSSEALSDALLTWAQWQGINADSKTVKVTLNTDFAVAGIDSQTLVALMSAAQSGLISWDTWFFNIMRGELTPEGLDAETERQLIELGPQQSARGPAEEEEEEEETEEEDDTEETEEE